MIKRISMPPNETRNQLLFQVLMASVAGAVIGCVIGYYLLF